METKRDGVNGNSDETKSPLPSGGLEPVETTRGTFYVRHLSIGDFRAFDKYLGGGEEKPKVDFAELGKDSLLTLVRVDSDASKRAPLSEEAYAAFVDSDLKALAEGVVKACELEPLSDGNALESLGARMLDYLCEEKRRIDEASAAITRGIDERFGALSKSLRTTLQQNLVDLSTIGNSLKMLPVVEEARKAQERYQQMLKAVPKLDEQMKVATAATAALRAHEKTASLIRSLPTAAISGVGLNGETGATGNLEFTRGPVIPRYEDTAAGRTAQRAAAAGEEAAQQLREVAGLVGQMAVQMGALQTKVLTEVLPAWFENLEEGSKATNTTLAQAERSLFWAKWALIASVAVTVLMTCWQLWVGREYKLENDQQQSASESLQRQQLEALRKLVEQQASESKQLREEVAHLNSQAQPPASRK